MIDVTFPIVNVLLARVKQRWKGHQVKDILLKVDRALRFDGDVSHRPSQRDSWDTLRKTTTVVASKENTVATQRKGKYRSAIKRMAFGGDRRSPSINREGRRRSAIRSSVVFVKRSMAPDRQPVSGSVDDDRNSGLKEIYDINANR